MGVPQGPWLGTVTTSQIVTEFSGQGSLIGVLS